MIVATVSNCGFCGFVLARALSERQFAPYVYVGNKGDPQNPQGVTDDAVGRSQ